MSEKEQALKMIEGRIETITNLSLECIEMIYNAGYNDALEKAAQHCDRLGEMGIAQDLRAGLK